MKWWITRQLQIMEKKNKVSLQEKVQETYKNLSVAEKEKKGDGLMEYIKKVEYGKNSLKIQKRALQ